MNFDAFLDSLQYMGKGMIGIFFVILLIYLSIVVLGKVFPVKPEK